MESTLCSRSPELPSSSFRPRSCCPGGLHGKAAAVGLQRALPALLCGLVSLLAACDDGDTIVVTEPPAGEPAPSVERPLVVVTERETPDDPLQYLHVLADWPLDGQLDFGRSVELGSFVNVRAMGDAVYVYDPSSSAVSRYIVSDTLGVTLDPLTLSFSSYGLTIDADHIWVGPERAYLVDEGSAQIVLWNPREMTIIGSTPIDVPWLERGGFRAQLQQGATSGGRAITAVNWRDWETYEFEPGAALALFDASSDAPALTLLEDERCAPSVALNPFFDADGNAYVIGDGGLGFDVMASPNRTSLPQCVLRVRAGEESFDPDFFVDIGAATGSPGFYTAHPMRDRKLLVNTWASDVDLEAVRDPADPSWYWDFPPYFEHTIVDLETGTAQRVTALERAAVQFSITLRVDDDNYVQLYAEDGASLRLYRVNTDASVESVLELGEGEDVQYLGRLD